MVQTLFNAAIIILNWLYNEIILRIVLLLHVNIPGFDGLMNSLNFYFNEYIYKYLKFIIHTLNNALHIPGYVWGFFIHLITWSLIVYLPIRLFLLGVNIYSLYRNGNKQ